MFDLYKTRSLVHVWGRGKGCQNEREMRSDDIGRVMVFRQKGILQHKSFSTAQSCTLVDWWSIKAPDCLNSLQIGLGNYSSQAK